jgi:pyridoxamine 5'-phosphate oxidase
MINNKLDKIEEKIKKEIINSISKKKNSFKNALLSTVSRNKPNLRIVILRDFSNDWNIFFYTDVRSRKIEEIEKNKNVSILLYDDEKKNQIRMYGTSNIYRNQKDIWEQLPASSKSNYNSILKPGEYQKTHLTEFNKELEFGYNNFCLIKVKINNIDSLYLSKKGNRRIGIKISRENEDIIFKKRWLVP